MESWSNLKEVLFVENSILPTGTSSRAILLFPEVWRKPIEKNNQWFTSTPALYACLNHAQLLTPHDDKLYRYFKGVYNSHQGSLLASFLAMFLLRTISSQILIFDLSSITSSASAY